MFDRLVASHGPPGSFKRKGSAALFGVTIHGLVLSGLIGVSGRVEESPASGVIDTIEVILQVPATPATGAGPTAGRSRVSLPVPDVAVPDFPDLDRLSVSIVPLELSTGARIDPVVYGRPVMPARDLLGDGTHGDPAGTARAADQAPKLVGCPPPARTAVPPVGQVTVRVVISADGRPEMDGAMVIRATDRRVRDLALQTLAGCRYEPGRLNGHAVRVMVVQPLKFGRRTGG